MSSSSPNAAVGTDAQAASAQTTSTQSQKDVKVSHGRGGMLLPMSIAQYLTVTDRDCKHWER